MYIYIYIYTSTIPSFEYFYSSTDPLLLRLVCEIPSSLSNRSFRNDLWRMEGREKSERRKRKREKREGEVRGGGGKIDGKKEKKSERVFPLSRTASLHTN